MLNYQNKYKSRPPHKTIKILHNFFLQEGFQLKITENQETEAGTWYCHLELIKNERVFLTSNGKGINEIFSLASGYAELYERYCNQCPIITNLLYNFITLTNNKKNRGYYYEEREKQIALDDYLKYPIFRDILTEYSFSEQDLEKNIRFYTNNILVGVPYTDYYTGDSIYLNPTLLTRISGSQGMAAGNTLEEALIQANSEIYEKYVDQAFFFNDIEQYHCIDLNTIANATLNEKIKKIKAKGYNFYIVDLSYNFKMPVLMSVLVDVDKAGIYINFGAFPVFDIALERIITELYQGTFSYKTSNCAVQPYRIQNKIDVLSFYCNSCVENFFPEDFFNKIIYTDYNKEVFISSNSNKTLINYFKELNHKLNYTFYYRDTSKLNNFYSIQLVCPDLEINLEKKEWIKSYKSKVNYENVQYIKSLIIQLNNDLLNQNYNYDIYNELFTLINIYPFDYSYTFYLSLCDNFNFYRENNDILHLCSLLFSDLDNRTIMAQFYNTAYEKNAIKFLLAEDYIKNKNYSNEEILHLFNNIFNLNLSLEDIQNINNGNYLIQKIFFDVFCAMIQDLLTGQ